LRRDDFSLAVADLHRRRRIRHEVSNRSPAAPFVGWWITMRQLWALDSYDLIIGAAIAFSLAIVIVVAPIWGSRAQESSRAGPLVRQVRRQVRGRAAELAERPTMPTKLKLQ
jgi:hypothetical protein